VRDVENANANDLLKIPAAQGSKVVLVKIESTSESDAKGVATSLSSQHGITKIDVIIANSGIASYYGPIKETPVAEFEQHLRVNAIGPVILLQAMLPLLQAAPKPKFVVISSTIGSIAFMDNLQVPAAAYGASKAAVNFLVRKVHFEHPELVAFSIHPGYVFGCIEVIEIGPADSLIDWFRQIWVTTVRESLALKVHPRRSRIAWPG
jgi:norsolorinic acid ketoreductase